MHACACAREQRLYLLQAAADAAGAEVVETAAAGEASEAATGTRARRWSTEGSAAAPKADVGRDDESGDDGA